jgi:hypothetical protein
LRFGPSQTIATSHHGRHHRRLARFIILSDPASARGHPPSCKPQLILIVINRTARLLTDHTSRVHICGSSSHRLNLSSALYRSCIGDRISLNSCLDRLSPPRWASRSHNADRRINRTRPVEPVLVLSK